MDAEAAEDLTQEEFAARFFDEHCNYDGEWVVEILNDPKEQETIRDGVAKGNQSFKDMATSLQAALEGAEVAMQRIRIDHRIVMPAKIEKLEHDLAVKRSQPSTDWSTNNGIRIQLRYLGDTLKEYADMDFLVALYDRGQKFCASLQQPIPAQSVTYECVHSTVHFRQPIVDVACWDNSVCASDAAIDTAEDADNDFIDNETRMIVNSKAKKNAPPRPVANHYMDRKPMSLQLFEGDPYVKEKVPESVPMSELRPDKFAARFFDNFCDGHGKLVVENLMDPKKQETIRNGVAQNDPGSKEKSKRLKATLEKAEEAMYRIRCVTIPGLLHGIKNDKTSETGTTTDMSTLSRIGFEEKMIEKYRMELIDLKFLDCIYGHGQKFCAQLQELE